DVRAVAASQVADANAAPIDVQFTMVPRDELIPSRAVELDKAILGSAQHALSGAAKAELSAFVGSGKNGQANGRRHGWISGQSPLVPSGWTMCYRGYSRGWRVLSSMTTISFATIGRLTARMTACWASCFT